jgi:hypothetical protein
VPAMRLGARTGRVLGLCDGHRYPVFQGIPVLLDETAIAGNPQYAGQRAYFDSEFRGYERYSLENWRVAYLDRLRASCLFENSGSPLVDVGVGGSGYTVIEAARAGRPAVGATCRSRVSSQRAGSRMRKASERKHSGSAARLSGSRTLPARSARR